MTTKLLNFALFQVGWFACVLGAAHGHAALGALTMVVLTSVNLLTVARPRRELWLWAAVLLVGAGADSALLAAGLTGYASPNALAPGWIVPAWIAALWVGFGSLLGSSLAWLGPRPLLAFALGAVGGPASFLAGARLGAVELGPHPRWSLAALAAEWALLTPLCLWLASSVRTGAARPRP